MSLEEYEKDEPKLILADQCTLVMQSDLPKTHTELGKLLWTAFNLGKLYRDKGGKD